MSEVVWKEIPEFDGYLISSVGDVKGKRIKKLKQRTDKDGYCVLDIRCQGIKKTLKVHRLVAQAFIPNPDNKPQVNHMNGNKTDNKISNLEWTTGKENVNHRFEKLGQTVTAEWNRKPVIYWSKDHIMWFPSSLEADRQLGLREGYTSNSINKTIQKEWMGYQIKYCDN